MKKTIYLLMFLALTLLSTTNVDAQHKAKPFEHLSVSLNAGTLGWGVQVASPVNKYLSLRTGLMMLTYTYKYDYDKVIHFDGYEDYSDIPMKAKANMINGMLMADVFPFPNVPIHATVGFYMGTSDILKVSAAYAGRPVEIGDVFVEPVNKKAAAHLETNGFKPYLGIGFGRSVTKSKRVGFKFELGAMFHGSPKIVVTEGKVISKEDLEGLIEDHKLSDFNDFIKDFNVYPVLNFQLSFRAF